MIKNLFILIFAITMISCHCEPTFEKHYNNLAITIDTLTFNADTIKIITLKHLTPSNLYGLHCKMCHGVNGLGDGVKARHDLTICPYDLTKVKNPDQELYYIILNGKNKMPNQYELDSGNVWLIIIYIKKFKEQ